MCSDAHSITLNKARNIFRTLNNVWKSSQYSKPTKIKLPELRTIYFAMDQNAENNSIKLSVVSYQKIKKNPAHYLAQQDF